MTEPSQILIGDTIEQMGTLPEKCVQCCVTSPPYWGLRDYGVDGQIGLESTPEEFVAKMVDVGRAVHRVLRDDGTFWLNIGDSYAATTKQTGRNDNGQRADAPASWKCRYEYERTKIRTSGNLKPKDLCMMPWRVAMALQADGWWIRSVIVWAKKSPMPESCTDRPTSSWEPIFLLAKSADYFYDAEAVKDVSVSGGEPTKYGKGDGGRALSMGRIPSGNERPEANPIIPFTRNQRNVWHLGPEPYSEAHFATFPTEIPRRAIKAGTSEKGCCPACRAPWERIVERKRLWNGEEITGSYVSDAGKSASAGPRPNTKTKTLGWRPTCDCNAGDPVPCLVLDPFLGSGTTVAVAREMGRFGVGCELNPEYAKLAKERIGRAERPETYRDDTKETDAPLFMENQ